MRTLLVLSLSFAVAGCGSLSSRVFDHPLLATADGPVATLVVVRPSPPESLLPATVYLDGEPVVRLRTGDYAELAIAPGTYPIQTVGDPEEPGRLQTIVLPEGRTHYLVQHYWWLRSSSAAEVTPYLQDFRRVE